MSSTAASAIAACAAVGFVSGFIVVRLGVNSFVATLGVSQLVTGGVLYVSENRQLTGAFSDLYKDFGRSEYLGVPVIFLYLLVLAGIAWFVLEQTPLGRRLYATGANAEAARLAGVPTHRLIWGSLVVSASIAGLGGVLFSMKTGTFSTSIGHPPTRRGAPVRSASRPPDPDRRTCGRTRGGERRGTCWIHWG